MKSSTDVLNTKTLQINCQIIFLQSPSVFINANKAVIAFLIFAFDCFFFLAKIITNYYFNVQ